MPKIYFIIHFFLGCYILRILSFDWPATFWPLTREPNFCQIWDWLCNINKNISFHFRLFQGKANDKIFQKIQRSLFWGHFWPFFSKFGQKWIFLENRALSVFKYSNHLRLRKNTEKTNDPFLRKISNWLTDRQTNGDF